MSKFMKKNVTKLLIIVFIITFNSVFAFAIADGVIGTSHDMSEIFFSTDSIGRCSICHVSHKVAGSGPYLIYEKNSWTGRDWPNPNRGMGPEGELGNMCYACHSSNGYGSTALTEASYAEMYVFPGVGLGRQSHGLTVTKEYEEGTVGSKFPYATLDDYFDKKGKTNTIQCTTCHNVHDNKTNQPFLRDNIKTLCSKCHKKDSTHSGKFNVSITNDKEGSPAVLWKGIGFELTFTLLPFESPIGITDGMSPGDGSGVWNLGRHLATDEIKGKLPGTGQEGGITCVTCHAVHGVQDDSDANSPITLPNKNLLAFP